MPVWLRLKTKSVRTNWEKYTKRKNKTAWKSYKTVGAVKMRDFIKLAKICKNTDMSFGKNSVHLK